jgi:glycoprotein 2-beta-D-xylosyltransferase
VDLRHARIHRPIQSIAQDGGNHDPRFQFASVKVHCNDCAIDQGHHVWNNVFTAVPEANQSVCEPRENVTALEMASMTFIPRRAIVLSRRDDHNPFFQLSATLTAWIMMRVLEWDANSTQLVYFDAGFPSPIDVLQKAMLSPQHNVTTGTELMGKMVHFDQVLVAPFELSGPMMMHLNDEEPCYSNQLLHEFRDHAMQALHVPMTKHDEASCTVTIITRKPYQGRMVQRKWLNEAQIMDRMTRDYASSGYKYGKCRFQSVDFVTLSLAEQMRVMVDSDVVIGMHGAGMVNVLWTRPGTVVLEIFPKRRKRWGYRNLCQFLGCEWHDFRGGQDTGKGDNRSDKTIPYKEWKAFFDPYFRVAMLALEARVEAALQRV